MARKRGSGAFLAGTMLVGSAATGASQVSAAGPYQTQRQAYTYNNSYGYGHASSQNLNKLLTINDVNGSSSTNNFSTESEKYSLEVATNIMNSLQRNLSNNIRLKSRSVNERDSLIYVSQTKNIVNSNNICDTYELRIDVHEKELIVGAQRINNNEGNYYRLYLKEGSYGQIKYCNAKELLTELNNYLLKGTGYSLNNKFELSIGNVPMSEVFTERQNAYNQGYSQAYTQAVNTLMQNPIFSQMMANSWMMYQNVARQNMYNQNNNWQYQNMYNQNNNWQYQNMYNQNNNWQYQNMYNQNYWQNTQQNNQKAETKLEANSIISDDTYLDKAWEKDKFLVTKNGKELRIKGHAGNQLVYDAENDEFKEIKNRDLDWKTAEPNGKPYESQGEFFRGLIDILQSEGKLVRPGKITGENNFKDKDGADNYFEIQDNGKKVFINFHNMTPVVYDCVKGEFYVGNQGRKQSDVDMTKPTEFNFIRDKFNPLINKLKAQNKIFKGVRIEGKSFYAKNGNKYEYSVDQNDNVKIRRVLTENNTNVLITDNLNAPSAVATYNARLGNLDIEGDESREDFKPLINYLIENKIIGERIDWDNGKFHTKNGKSYDFKLGKDNRLYLKDATGKCFVYDSKKSGLAQGNFDTEQTTSNFISNKEANTVLENVRSLIESYKSEGFDLTAQQ